MSGQWPHSRIGDQEAKDWVGIESQFEQGKKDQKRPEEGKIDQRLSLEQGKVSLQYSEAGKDAQSNSEARKKAQRIV